MQAFEKLHSIVPRSPTVIYNIAHLHEMMGNFRAAAKWFNILVTCVPTDPGILYRCVVRSQHKKRPTHVLLANFYTSTLA